MVEDPLEDTPLAERFRRFAEVETRGASPLYTQLALTVAESDILLEIAAEHPPSQPPANMLFGAVHYLLQKHPDHPLAAYYPTLTPTPKPPEDVGPVFTRFCEEYREEIITLLETRRVQTNEVGRSALLLPGFASIVALTRGLKPFALIEIGSSAGLNLMWDRYSYTYHTEGGLMLRAGNPDSPVRLSTTIRGRGLPPMPAEMPTIASRQGIDPYPIDVNNEDAVRWLKALVWPEHTERLKRLEAALTMARHDPPPVLGGDALTMLPTLLEAVPKEHLLVLYHTFTTYQLTPGERERLKGMLEEASRERDLYQVVVEWFSGARSPTLKLIAHTDESRSDEVLAHVDPHGGWIDWLES